MFDKLYYGNTIWEWAVTLVIIVLSLIAARLAYWIFKNWLKILVRRTSFRMDDTLIDLAEEPVVLMIVIFGTRWSVSILTLSDRVVEIAGHVFTFAIAISITWLIARTYDAIHKRYVAPLADETGTNLDDQLLPVIRTGVRIILWTLGIIIALDNAGYNVGTILAGLGIGGLAFALAAQDTVSNVFGGVTILLQQPFQIDDVIILDGRWLQVQQIGLRASRLEDFDTGHEVTIPNSKFTSSVITNVSRYPSHIKKLSLHISPAISTEQLTQGLEILKEAVNNHPEAETVFIRLDQFEPGAIVVVFIYRILAFKDRHRVTTEVNLEIMRALETHGIKLALPIKYQVDLGSEPGVYG